VGNEPHANGLKLLIADDDRQQPQLRWHFKYAWRDISSKISEEMERKRSGVRTGRSKAKWNWAPRLLPNVPITAKGMVQRRLRPLSFCERREVLTMARDKVISVHGGLDTSVMVPG